VNAAFRERYGTPGLWRHGPARWPHGVTVADPATATGAPTTTTSAAVITGRVPDGTDRLQYDVGNETVTGVRDPHANIDGHWPDAPTAVGMQCAEVRPATANATDKGWACQDWSSRGPTARCEALRPSR
jgi:hypothetical protein